LLRCPYAVIHLVRDAILSCAGWSRRRRIKEGDGGHGSAMVASI
jgi:hypothetical protein